MKVKMKSMIMLLALCALSAGAKAQTVSVANVEALPGETVTFTLDLTGGKANTYTAMQFDVQFPATGFTTTGDYSVSSAWKNATSTIGAVDVNGVATIPVASSESINAADVEGLLSVSFSVGSGVAIGEYDVTLQNLWFGYGTSSKDYLADVTFKVKVVAMHTVELDETSTTLPPTVDGVNVIVHRTIKADEWSTICLPFAMTETQVKAAFGNGVKLCDFTGCEATYDETGENIVALKVNFAEVSAIEANRPYIIKAEADISTFTAADVDINPSEELSVDRDEDKYKRNGKWYYDYNSFIGTYVANTEIPEQALFLSGNKFWYSKGMTKSKAFRGYFSFYQILSSLENAEARIGMAFHDDNATGIVAARSKKADVGSDTYDLQGRKVQKGMKPGLYVKGGKKLVVK